MFIYLITNKISGKVYVGRTQKTVEARWRLHIKTAKSGSRLSVHTAIRDFGPDAFLVKTLAEAKTVEEFESLEKEFIAKYQATNPECGYNGTAGGNGFSGTHSETTRTKMRLSHQGKKRSKESREKQGQTTRELIRKGQIVSPRRLGKRWSPEQKELRKQFALKQWAEAKALGKTTL